MCRTMCVRMLGMLFLRKTRGNRSFTMKHLLFVITILLNSCVALSQGFFFECSEDLDVDSYRSSASIQNCSADSLEINLQFHEEITSADVQGILECDDTVETRTLTSTNTVRSAGVMSYEIDPPFDEANCSITLCYTNEWYDPYTILLDADVFQFRQGKCVLPEVMPSVTNSDEYNSTRVKTETHQQTASPDLIPMITTTPKFLVMSSAMSSAAGLSLQPIPAVSTSEHVVRSHHHSTLSHQASSAYSNATDSHSISTAPTNISTVPANSHSISTVTTASRSTISTTVTLYPLPSSEAQGSTQLTLILTISILLSATCVIAIATIVFCIFRIAIQYSKQDIQEDSPINIEGISKNYVEISSSPSICTIVSPLTPITDENMNSSYALFSFNIGVEQLAPIETSDVSITIDASSCDSSFAASIASADQITQRITHSDGSSGSNYSTDTDKNFLTTDSKSFLVESENLIQEEKRQGDIQIDHSNDDQDPEHNAYIHIVDRYEVISPSEHYHT